MVYSNKDYIIYQKKLYKLHLLKQKGLISKSRYNLELNNLIRELKRIKFQRKFEILNNLYRLKRFF